MVSDILELVEIIRKLVQRKSELDKEYFEQFIEPTWEAFVKVHEAYIASLLEYIELSKQFKTRKLFNRIQHDSAHRATLRIELSRLLKYMPSSKFKSRKEYYTQFVKAIVDYFDVWGKLTIEREYSPTPSPPENFEFISQLHGSPVRTQLYNQILRMKFMDKEITQNSDSSLPNYRIEQLLRDLLTNLQENYKNVADSYYYLRKELLT